MFWSVFVSFFRSEKLQNESFPNFSNSRPEFCPEFCSEISPNFSSTFRASFCGRRRPENFTKNPCHFSMQNSQANTKKMFTKFFWRAGRVIFLCSNVAARDPQRLHSHRKGPSCFPAQILAVWICWGAPKGRQQKGETGPGTHIFADFCRFSLIFGSLCKSRDLGGADLHRKPQETADFRRKPQETADSCRNRFLPFAVSVFGALLIWVVKLPDTDFKFALALGANLFLTSF